MFGSLITLSLVFKQASIECSVKLQVNFGCILNDTEVMQVVKVTNHSPMDVKYQWSFIDSAIQFENKEEDEGLLSSKSLFSFPSTVHFFLELFQRISGVIVAWTFHCQHRYDSL